MQLHLFQMNKLSFLNFGEGFEKEKQFGFLS